MKIWLISQSFPPTRIASSVRAERMARLLSKAHTVTVLTENHKGGNQKNRENFQIISCYSYKSSSFAFLGRTWAQLSFMFSVIWRGLFLEKPDLIIATSPPLFSAFAGAILAFLKRGKFILDIRDLWPESMIVLGILQNRLLIFLSRAMERWTYSRADLITVVTPRIRHHLRTRLKNKRVELLMNATDINFFSPQKKSKTLANFANGDFVVSYLGIFGRAQALENIIRSAERLKKFSSIKFLLVGQGDDEARLRALAQKQKNIKILGYQHKEKIVDFINLSDVCLVPLGKNKLFSGAIPSKTFEYLACAKPVIAAARGDIEKIVINKKVGLVVPPENPEALAKAILTLYRSPKLCQKLGANGRALVESKFSEASFEETLNYLLAATIGIGS